MTQSRWERIEALFHGALELPRAERARWLRETCPDADLVAEVERLLAAEAASTGGTFIAGAVEGAAGLVREEAGPQTRAGQQFGPWRLLEEIGRGGMGTVWLAERADDAYSARVALKLVRGSLSSPELERRFRAERQILADLQHPNIARLVDGGAGPDGVPFLAMEYVAGVPITAYVDTHDSGLEERLRLFLTVCDAVQHAHGALVVHRDLKPSNILVDDQGTPTLVDFGIAKLLGETADQDLTRAVPLTPAYASPEQVRGERVTVASDVFSLGVVLYELLTGQQPFRQEGATPLDLQQSILERDPALPSTVAGGSAAGRSVADRVNPRALAGDLDRIVMMALRKEPVRRYATVQQLADDIRRFLDGLPVSARPATAGYRLSKFVARNRTAVAASTVGLLVVVGLIGFYTARLARERDVAERERATAEQVVAFLTEMFQQAGPGQALGDSITVRVALGRGRERLGTELEGEPGVRARLLDAIGVTYLNLAAFATADSVLRDALALQESVGGDDAPGTADVLDHLATLEARRDNEAQGRVYAERAVRIREAVGDPVALAVSVRGLADQVGVSSPDSAIALMERAVRLEATVLAPDDPKVASTRYALGIALLRAGRYPQAIETLRAVRSIREAHLPENHPDRSATLNVLAIAYGQNQQHDSARALFEQILDRQLKVFGPDHPETATALANLATELPPEHLPDSAATLLLRALDIRRRVHGEGSADVANTLMTLGNNFNAGPNRAEAVPYYRQAIAIYDSVLPPLHRNAYFPQYNLGVTLNDLDRPAEARPYLERALAIAEQVLGVDHPSTAITLFALGESLQSLGDTAGAVRLFEDSRTRFDRGAPGHPWVAYPAEGLIRVHRRRGAWSEVERLSGEYWNSIEQIHDSDADGLAAALEARAEAARGSGRTAQADSLQTRAQALRAEGS